MLEVPIGVFFHNAFLEQEARDETRLAGFRCLGFAGLRGFGIDRVDDLKPYAYPGVISGIDDTFQIRIFVRASLL